MNDYPIGQQDFMTLRNDRAIYVDKTMYIDQIAHSASKYYFLARPRRFGKSLFLSTLQYFYQGQRELFKGLYADCIRWNWEQYPVLHLDLNTNRYDEIGKLETVLDPIFSEWENIYGINRISDDLGQRFRSIIKGAHANTGKKVVILIDEYDKPLVSNLNDLPKFEHYRSVLSAIYSNFKSSAADIKLVFLTGVSRFSKLSIFSDLNNLNDISFDDQYANICGITAQELLQYFQDGIREFAAKRDISVTEAIDLLKKNYDGYRFALEGSEIYNPWSLLCCLSKKRVGYYWNDTGMPTLVAETLKRVGADLEKSFNAICKEDKLKGLDLLNPDPISLLYQTGYLTLKEYIKPLDAFRLGIPNEEVESGLFNLLLPYYIKSKTGTPDETVEGIVNNFILGNPDEAMKCVQAYFAGIDFKMKMDNENNFHNAFYILLSLLGLQTHTEVHTSDGSIDIVVKTPDFIYIIELKYDHSPEEALKQIEEKKYARPYQSDSRKIYLIGASFSSSTRCIESWIIKDY